MRGAESKLMSGAAVAGVMGPQQVSSSKFGGPPGHRSAGVQESMAGTTNVAAAVGLVSSLWIREINPIRKRGPLLVTKVDNLRPGWCNAQCDEECCRRARAQSAARRARRRGHAKGTAKVL